MDKYGLIENHGIVFTARPNAVPYNYRISYKVSQICLILSRSCRGKSGCLPVKLHMISFALCSNVTMDKLLEFAKNDFTAPPIVRFDPAVNRVVAFAIADQLIVQDMSGKYALTEKGKRLVEAIEKDHTVLATEKNDLSALSKKLSDAKIKQLSDVWRNAYAED